MSKTSDLLKFIVLFQIVFGIFVTATIHLLPADAVTYADPFAPTKTDNPQGIVSDINETVGKMKNPGIVETIGLIIFSGNLFMDLFVNSFFAIPEAFTMLIGGLMMFFPVAPYIQSQINILVFAVITVIYMIIILGFFTSIRSGTVV